MPFPALIKALFSPEAYPHPVSEVRLIETHISWVLLAGEYAYKLKKPVDLGFLDFSTLDKRRFCCDEEIRLNRRLAPDIYLDVLPVTGRSGKLQIGGDGPVLEWAVHMRAFPADSTLDQEPAISTTQIDAIADRVARFHKEIAPAPESSPYGSPAAVMHPVLENVRQLRELLPKQTDANNKIERLEQWSQTQGALLDDHFRQRKADGLIRDCHGDLHLGNIAWVDDAPLIFDCIEFNPALRQIDIVSEAAFLFMDLTASGHEPLAWRFINRWLEHTGDYAGLKGLRFYLVYRALVRAKVAAIRVTQGAHEGYAEVIRYLDLAETLCKQPPVQLTLMHGHSGSGKTWVSQRLLETLGAIRLRSDVERKRLFGVDALEDSRSIPGGIYGPDASRRTLACLQKLAGILIHDGFSVIVDATFLARTWRQLFIDLAQEYGAPIHIVSMNVPAYLMRQRVADRTQRGDDASEAGIDILESQLKGATPLDNSELNVTYQFNPDEHNSWSRLLAAYRLHI
jgi:hypothetical protein